MRIRGLPGLLLLGAALLFIVPSSVTYYTDWLWFQELHYEGIFVRTLNAQFAVFAATFAAVFGFLYLNLRAARGTIMRAQVVVGTGPDGRAISVETAPFTGLALPVAALVALMLGIAAGGRWQMWLSFFNATSFGQTDPLFGRDISFYVFRLPVWQSIQQQALITTVLAMVGCGLYYVLSGSFVIEPRRGAGFFPRIRLVTRARRHIGLLAAVVFALMAWGTWFAIPGTLISQANVIHGASYVDVYARLPILRLTVAVLAAGSGLAVLYGFSRTAWPLPVAVLMYVVVSFGGGIYSASIQRLIVVPDELNREQPYIVNHIEATRRAYAVDSVEERDVSGDAELSAKDIISNSATIENIRLWDHQPLLQTFAQIQEIRTYYDFKNVDNDRYVINGRYRQVMLSARELNTESMQNRSWVNERLTFTHGYGLTLGPVNQVTTEGLPVLFIRDLPPVSTVNLPVDQPSIYFGELSSNYALVRTKQPEFHYPRGDDNETTTYQGSGGVAIGSFWRRLMFAIRFADTDILFTNQLTSESRILYHRAIADRVQLLAPFLTFDADPYPVLSEGRLFWIQDAYTTTANYPYSAPTIFRGQTINYIRNSVKIVIDAYHGSTSFYLADPADAVAQTLAKIFPGMLRPIAEMPPDLRTHVRYPEDIFNIQAGVFQVYHMTNPTVFYNKEDQWQVPVLEKGDRAQEAMQPYYTMMRLPGSDQTEFIQMLPFTPRLKENLAAWMVARSDGANYGRLLVFQFPKQKVVFGPKQIVGKINQDEVISPKITLWNQQGSRVIWGTLLVIPVNESLIYVRPLYLQSPEGRIPELKQVIVAYQNRIEMAETLVLALGRIFGSSIISALAPDRLDSSATSVVMTAPEAEAAAATTPTVSTPAVPDATIASLINEMQQHYEAADKAMKSGDLVLWAEENKKVREIFERLVKLKKLP
jgi:uncharacterized membrane protein (UPF0182 family)